MGLKDLIVTPIFLIILTSLAYFVRPFLTNDETRKYFLPALWVRFFGAISLGLIYQFYYGGGDTFNYFHQGKLVRDAFLESPRIGFSILSSDGEYDSLIYKYTSQMIWYRSKTEFFIVKIVGVISLITAHTYSAISLFFSFFSFIGVWLIYSCIQSHWSIKSRFLAFGILFLPTVVFWGSGILKDAITLGALGGSFWAFYQLIEKRRYKWSVVLICIISSYLIFSIKIYILLCLIPCLFLWQYLKVLRSVNSSVLKALMIPIFLVVFVSIGYALLVEVSDTSSRYRLDSLAEWSYITSHDIRYWTGKDAGSGYDIGIQDGTWQTLLKLAPAAINVSLFRPYLWEVSNPLMLLSAIESTFLFVLTIRVLPSFFAGKRISTLTLFMLSFSLLFAFAVGASTYNFGTLSRYKIPLLPFYISILIVASAKPKVLIPRA